MAGRANSGVGHVCNRQSQGPSALYQTTGQCILSVQAHYQGNGHETDGKR